MEIKDTVPVLRLNDDQNKTWVAGDEIAKISFYSSDASGIGAHETGFISNITEVGSTSLSGALVFGTAPYNTAASEVMRIDDAGNVGIGTSSPSGILHLQKSSGGNVELHMLETTGGTSYGAAIDAWNGSGGNLRIRTHDSGGTYQERMRIDSSGNLLVGKTSADDTTVGVRINGPFGFVSAVRSGNLPLLINRITNDGVLIDLRQNGTSEGTITVSGTTVSYNGGHLSRWSQLSDNTKDETIVKGTVMANLNQMAEWTTDGVTEDNEQLNCMAVSSVEGDVNVAGVFVNWDEDDEVYTADMNVAMTGDMVIRIAQGVTVAQGDLLMSAGDGTAKPQDDDIIRAKTIAKVTSTHVSHTYDDGSYLVPCVLMAC